MKARGTLSVMAEIFKGYGWYFAAMTALGVAMALADGVSIASIIPIVSSLVPNAGQGAGATVTHAMQLAFSLLHLPFQFRYMLLFVALLIMGRAVLMALFVALRGIVGSRFLVSEIDDLYGLLLDTRWEFILREKAGHLQNTVLWDTKRAGQLLDGAVQLLQSATGFLIYLAVAIAISPSITIVTLCAGAVLAILLRPALKRARIFSEGTARLEKDIAQHIGEHVQAFKAVKASGVSREALAVARQYLSRFRSMLAKAVFVQSFGSIFIQPFGFLFAVVIFAFSYYSGTFNIAAFAATIYLIQKIFVYLDSTQASWGTIAQFVPFAEQVLVFKKRAHAEREGAAREGSEHFSFEREIVFQDVSLRYEGGTHALSGISFSIEKGSMCALVGPSGSGKTSVADLLLRLFTPERGEILVDGVPARDIALPQWRRKVGYVSQDVFLLHEKVADNIRFYDASVSDRDVEEAAKAAHIYDDIRRLPEGFDTVLGDRGATLSGGQRQRVALARALARKPEVLVLDEVTSALDSELEAQIRAVITELRGTLTLLVIAHRVSTVLDADRIIVMKDGKIEESGKPERMLADPTSYLSRILAMQRGDA